MTWRDSLVECECGHIRGDHKSSRSPVGRPVTAGTCRFCDCREFKPSVREQIDALSRAALTPIEDCEES